MENVLVQNHYLNGDNGQVKMVSYDIADPIRTCDINNTNWKIELQGYTFYFSRRFSMRNFIAKIKDYNRYVTDRVIPFLPAEQDTVTSGISLLAAISLYSNIEKNGVRIENEKGEEITCLTQIRVDVHFSKE